MRDAAWPRYEVRLWGEIDAGWGGNVVLLRRAVLPFVPFVGLNVQLPPVGDEGREFSETIAHVTWSVGWDSFDCQTQWKRSVWDVVNTRLASGGKRASAGAAPGELDEVTLAKCQEALAAGWQFALLGRAWGKFEVPEWALCPLDEMDPVVRRLAAVERAKGAK